MSKTNNKEILEAALSYVARGWLIFPLHSLEKDDEGVLQCTCGKLACPDAGKHPRLINGLRGASKHEDQAVLWFGAAAPLSNIAVVTGQVSGITVLDIDIGPNKNGDATWAELNAEAGEPDTLMAATGSGGLHVFFKYNSAPNTSSETLGDGVDCRNDRGYVVAAPSLHRSGNRYAWLDASKSLCDLPKHLATKKERRGRKRSDDPTRKKYNIEQVAAILKFVKADDRDLWRNIGVILGREFNRAEEAWKVYEDWSANWDGKPGRNHQQIMYEAFHEVSQKAGDLTIGTLIKAAMAGGWAPTTGNVPQEQFLYFAPSNNFIYRPTGAFWSAESVDAATSVVNEDGQIFKTSAWLKLRKLCTSMTNDPAIEDEVTNGMDCRDGCFIEGPGAALYNAYREPNIQLGDARLAKPFVEHCFRVFNKEGDADMFLDYLAHRVQKPGEKPRFALLIAGEQGVGKDTAISMCGPAIGVWNVANIDPMAFDQGFNEYVASVLVVISETANAHEMSKWAFNERTKVVIAGQPDYLTVNPKYGTKYSVRLHCGVILTTNHMTTGMFIPEDDRRYDVIEAATKAEMGLSDKEARVIYFQELWTWFNEDDGAKHIAAFLHQRDLSRFSASNGQRITLAHKKVVASGMTGDDFVGDALAALNEPEVLRLDFLFKTAENLFPGEVSRKEFNNRAHHALGRAGYQRLMNRDEKDGRWSKSMNGVRSKFIVYFDPERISMKDAVKRLDSLESLF